MALSAGVAAVASRGGNHLLHQREFTGHQTRRKDVPLSRTGVVADYHDCGPFPVYLFEHFQNIGRRYQVQLPVGSSVNKTDETPTIARAIAAQQMDQIPLNLNNGT